MLQSGSRASQQAHPLPFRLASIPEVKERYFPSEVYRFLMPQMTRISARVPYSLLSKASASLKATCMCWSVLAVYAAQA